MALIETAVRGWERLLDTTRADVVVRASYVHLESGQENWATLTIGTRTIYMDPSAAEILSRALHGASMRVKVMRKRDNGR